MEQPYCKRFVSLSLVGVEFRYSFMYISVEAEPAVKRAQRPNRVDCLIVLVLAAYNVSHSTVQSRHPHTHSLNDSVPAGKGKPGLFIHSVLKRAARQVVFGSWLLLFVFVALLELML